MNMNDLEQYAYENDIPIMQKDGIEFLKSFIKENQIKSILEIGSAIGYSAINMALIDEDIKVLTIERDKERFDMAQEFIGKFNLNERITILNKDALDEIKIDKKFDLIFIDAAKSKSIEFFNIYKEYLNENGYIITDNINFHGLRENKTEIKRRRTRQLMNKIDKYIEFLKTNQEFDTTFIEEGDGISISKRK